MTSLAFNDFQGSKAYEGCTASHNQQSPIWYVRRGVKIAPLVRLALTALLLVGGIALFLHTRVGGWLESLGLYCSVAGVMVGLAPVPWDLGICYGCPQNDDVHEEMIHAGENVSQKLWTPDNYRITLNTCPTSSAPTSKSQS